MEKAEKDKLTAVLTAEHHCEVKEHKTGCCWVQDDGEHIPLQRKDLSTWALWIVSGLYTDDVPYSLISVTLDLGERYHTGGAGRDEEAVGKKTKTN